jgi:uncharacterized protein (TIGR00290 family)
MADNIVVSWSGGKDSSLALERLMYNGNYKVCGLFTAYDVKNQWVKLHNVPIAMIRLQAESLGMPLYEIPLSPTASNAEYENAHFELFEKLKKEGIYNIGYGDIFLEEIKEYRDKMSAKAGMHFHYPLWNADAEDISEEFISRGFEAVITAIDTAKLDESFLGRHYNAAFIADLPDDVDICGENGEFHSYVFNGPIFSKAIHYKTGKIYKENYRPTVDMEMAFVEISSM